MPELTAQGGIVCVCVTTFAYLIATKSNSHAPHPASPTVATRKPKPSPRRTHFPFTVSRLSALRTVARNEICGQRVLRVLIDCKYQHCHSQ